jgi:hypothetical protein
VCLSLLGTWISGAKGEEWQPGVSTILQVLISIQAMVLCQDPEGNEPGFKAHYGLNDRGSASAYVKSIRSLTIKYGIMHWAPNLPSLWKEIVETHFHKQGDHILKTAERWAAESGRESYGGHDSSYMLMSYMDGRRIDMRKLLPGLQTTLKKYGITHVIQGAQQQSRGGGGEFGNQTSPYGGGNQFDGSGRKSGYGATGSRFGRGY